MEKDLEGKVGGNGKAKQDRNTGKKGLFAQALSFYVHLQVSVVGKNVQHSIVGRWDL